MGQQQTISKYRTKVQHDTKENLLRDYRARLVVTLYSTDVVTVLHDGTIILNNGGHETTTTKSRMNQASNEYKLGYHVFQNKYVWYVRWLGVVKPFTGPKITLNFWDWL